MAYSPHFDSSDNGINSVHSAIMEFTPGKLYRKDEMVVYNRKLYVALKNSASYSFLYANWRCVAGNITVTDIDELPTIGQDDIIYVVLYDITNSNMVTPYIWRDTAYIPLIVTSLGGNSFIMEATTTNDTPAEVYLDSNGRLVMDEGDIMMFEMKIFISNPSTLDSNVMTYVASIKRDSLTTTLSDPQVYTVYQNLSNAHFEISLSGDNSENVHFMVTGESNQSLNWKIYVNVKEFNVDGAPGM